MTDTPDKSPPEPRDSNGRIITANYRCKTCGRSGALHDYVGEGDGDGSLHVDCPACHSRIIAIVWGPE